jgi:putative transcriptional regulator
MADSRSGGDANLATRNFASGSRRANALLLAHYGAMEDDSLCGRLLAATPLLGDPNFRRTVILIVEDSRADGTLGVVLNRPTEVPLDEVLEPWTALVSGPAVVFRGGPISPNSALALALAQDSTEPVGWRSLAGSPLMGRLGLVDLGAPPELLAEAISSMRVFAGYAGWAAGQLREEIDEGAWYVLPGNPADAFVQDPERLWREVLRRQGGELALVATYPDDPVWN